MSKLYLVERVDEVRYDEYAKFVVLAKTPGEARQICAEESEAEGKVIWQTATTTTIGYPHPMLKEGSRVILGDFNAG
jgi:hypothetical protein